MLIGVNKSRNTSRCESLGFFETIVCCIVFVVMASEAACGFFISEKIHSETFFKDLLISLR